MDEIEARSWKQRMVHQLDESPPQRARAKTRTVPRAGVVGAGSAGEEANWGEWKSYSSGAGSHMLQER